VLLDSLVESSFTDENMIERSNSYTKHSFLNKNRGWSI
jgi:hypothetical protein